MGNTIHQQQKQKQQRSKYRKGIKKRDGDPYGSHKRNKPMRAYLNAIVSFSEPDEAISYFMHHIME